MKLKKIRVRRFLSFGEDWTEIDFEKLGQIINICGENLDYGEGYSNGSGKSSILDVIVYGIYGKLLKGLNHKNANHIYSKKGLEIEIFVDDMKIRRTRSPDELTLFVDGKELSLGGIPSTQEEINKRLKLSYEGFVNVAIFGQHSFHGFLESDAAEKRKIAENLLGLDNYARYHDIAKSQKKFLADSIKEIETKFEMLSESNRVSGAKVMTLKSQQSQWLMNRSKEIQNIKDRLKNISLEKSLLKMPILSQESANLEIEKINNIIKEKETRRNSILKILEESELKAEHTRKNYESLSASVATLSAKLKESHYICKKRKSEIDEIESSKGKRCPRCLGVVKEENIKLLSEGIQKDFSQSSAEFESLQSQFSQQSASFEDVKLKYEKISLARSKAKKEESSISLEISALMKEKANYVIVPIDSKMAIFDKEVELLQDRLSKAEIELKEGDPFRELVLIAESDMEKNQKELSELKEEVEHKKKLMPYYDYWVKGFGDKGIRSFLLEERLPSLNSRIAHWLNILIDNRIKLTFDRDLNESIKRVLDDDKKFIYNSLSGGELRRIDLAISQAFAYAATMSSGACPSIVALDEIGTNFDRPGMLAVYRMICELSKDRQILIITHDPDLLEMLRGCDTITARMKNGVTKIEICSSRKALS